MSVIRIDRRIRWATSTSTRSARIGPSASLIVLKSSRSMMAMLTASLVIEARRSARATSSRKAFRLRSRVSGSVVSASLRSRSRLRRSVTSVAFSTTPPTAGMCRMSVSTVSKSRIDPSA